MYGIFCDKVKKHPNHTAVVIQEKNQRFTYAETDSLVNTLSRYLLKQGVKPGQRIGILTNHEWLHFFFLLAIDKINATYVPFDSDVKTNKFILDIQKLSLPHFFIDTDLSEKFSYNIENTHKIEGNNFLHELSQNATNTELEIIERDPNVPLYIVGSSGSSGDKKWIGIQSDGLSYWERTMEKVFNFKVGHKVLCARSPAFDARIWEYLCAITTAGELHLVSKQDRKDTFSLIRYIENLKEERNESITELLFIASQLDLENLETILARLKRAGLINIVVTGDTCSFATQMLCERYKLNLFNAYGPTEATFGGSITLTNNLRMNDEKGLPIVPIGWPEGEEVKYHLVEEGRLVIESPYLSTGYIDDPAKTAKNFLTLIIDGKPTRVFDTGDLFTKEEKYLRYRGRVETAQDIKISGVKVDAFSVENTINHYDQAIQICVVPKIWMNRTKLFAYIVVGQDFDKTKFLGYVSNSLSKEEIPFFIVLEEMPRLLASGKLDRQALKKREDKEEEYLTYVKSQQDSLESEIVTKLKHYWKTLLGTEPDTLNADFNEYGGDSMLTVRFIGMINRELDSSLTYMDFLQLERISINEIAAIIENKKKRETEITEKEEALIHLLTPEDKSNIFFLPALLGDGLYSYRKMAKTYSDRYNYTVYGLSDPGVYDENRIPVSLEHAVSRYVNSILNKQPKGPYRLLGFSYGCSLAYHVAKKLTSLGHEVVEVQLVDGFPSVFYQKITDKQHTELLEELLGYLCQVLRNAFYDEKIDNILQYELKGLTKRQQIDKAFDLLEKAVVKSLSRSMLKLAKQHLLFLLEVEQPNQLSVATSLYFSNSRQKFRSLIDEVSDLDLKSIDHDYFYWNRYFHSIFSPKEVSTADHIQLLQAGLQDVNIKAARYLSDKGKSILNDHYAPFPLAKMEIEIHKFYKIVYFTILNLSYKEAEEIIKELSQMELTLEVTRFKQWDKNARHQQSDDCVFTSHFGLIIKAKGFCIGQSIPPATSVLLKYITEFKKINDRYCHPILEDAFQKRNALLKKEALANDKFTITLDFYCKNSSSGYKENNIMSFDLNFLGNPHEIIKSLEEEKFILKYKNKNHYHYQYETIEMFVFHALEEIERAMVKSIDFFMPNLLLETEVMKIVPHPKVKEKKPETNVRQIIKENLVQNETILDYTPFLWNQLYLMGNGIKDSILSRSIVHLSSSQREKIVSVKINTDIDKQMLVVFFDLLPNLKEIQYKMSIDKSPLDLTGEEICRYYAKGIKIKGIDSETLENIKNRIFSFIHGLVDYTDLNDWAFVQFKESPERISLFPEQLVTGPILYNVGETLKLGVDEIPQDFYKKVMETKNWFNEQDEKVKELGKSSEEYSKKISERKSALKREEMEKRQKEIIAKESALPEMNFNRHLIIPKEVRNSFIQMIMYGAKTSTIIEYFQTYPDLIREPVFEQKNYVKETIEYETLFQHLLHYAPLREEQLKIIDLIIKMRHFYREGRLYLSATQLFGDRGLYHAFYDGPSEHRSIMTAARLLMYGIRGKKQAKDFLTHALAIDFYCGEEQRENSRLEEIAELVGKFRPDDEEIMKRYTASRFRFA